MTQKSDITGGRIRLTLCLGSNCGDRVASVAEALEWIEMHLEDPAASAIYETPAYGHEGAPYMNAVAEGYLPASMLTTFEKECKIYETAHGRDAEARLENRVPIDIDIVVAGEDILRPTDYRCSFFRRGLSMLRLQSEECNFGICREKT